jgi:plasmid stabilization system protein ParE
VTTKLYRLEISDVARRQTAELNIWWRMHRSAARTAVRDELARVFRLILAQPEIGPRALDVELRDVRRIHLSRIAYSLYYRILDADNVIEVLAVWSDSRGTGPRL